MIVWCGLPGLQPVPPPVQRGGAPGAVGQPAERVRVGARRAGPRRARAPAARARPGARRAPRARRARRARPTRARARVCRLSYFLSLDTSNTYSFR